jgi:hemoglobin
MRDPHQLDPDHLPTPFTAEEIRAACPAGRTLRWRHEGAGQPSFINVSRYASVDADGCVQETWHESIEGTRVSVPRRDRATWLTLQQHASFSAATTTRTEETIEVPAGQFVCQRYTRTEPDAVWRFWFARDRPGQPVRLEQQIGDEVVFSAALMADMRTLYEAAGGEEGLRRLAGAWHARVMDDEEVRHAFSHGFQPNHTERLAAYWVEALGGPPAYSTAYGDETSVVRIHSGNGPHAEMDRRAIACFDQALVDAGLAEDAHLRDALHDYFAWATTTTMARYHDSADGVPDGLTVPRWSWQGLVTQTGPSRIGAK